MPKFLRQAQAGGKCYFSNRLHPGWFVALEVAGSFRTPTSLRTLYVCGRRSVPWTYHAFNRLPHWHTRWIITPCMVVGHRDDQPALE